MNDNIPLCALDGCMNECELGKNGRYKLHCSKSCRGKHNSLKSIEKRKQTNLKRYGCEFAIASTQTKKKIRESIIKKYGVDNISKIPEIQEKKENTLLKNYGVKYTTQSSLIKDKIKNTLINKYGVDHISYIGKTQEQIELLTNVDKIIELNKNYNLYHISKQYGFSDRSLRHILEKSNIDPIYHIRSSFEKSIFDFVSNNYEDEIIVNKKIDNKELDIYFPKLNFGIECNGAYWHSEISGGRNKNYHNEKTSHFTNLGIKVLHIWDFNWYNKQDIIKSMILHRLGNSKKEYARNTKIIELDYLRERLFFNANHIQGYVNSDKCYALVKDDIILSVMSFGKPRFDKKIDYELLRFANVLNTTVVGGASKLLSYFTKTNTGSIISYSHRDIGVGKLYNNLGFDKIRTTEPSYYYTKDYVKFFNRITFQKHKLEKKLNKFNSSLTEWENMKNNGYDRIWDCGNDVWLMNRD